ncbi:hypothetical protein JCM19300_870 [Algibacter lectus]|uniref:Uncharacterized protein n=1 Tax=Algibacter lectus TaxID=221126 RepID=A0A090VLN8_9FLAO|nr:hypothetical protein JCM19300_870 [Algibacter lectus]GAL82270.1 hypothetical protein JCM19274_1584 [Algibacter lectus]
MFKSNNISSGSFSPLEIMAFSLVKASFPLEHIRIDSTSPVKFKNRLVI